MIPGTRWGRNTLKLNRETRDTLRRYFLNADPFMWSVLKQRTKKKRIQELKEIGLLPGYSEGGNPNYSRINQDLLVDPGIEGILERVVVPRVKALFAPDVLDYFRRCWEQGQTPTLDYLKQHGLYTKHRLMGSETWEGGWNFNRVEGYRDAAFVFFQIDTRYNAVERWSVFGGLWFELIEPLLGATPNAGSAGAER
jgi:hypothetical protein